MLEIDVLISDHSVPQIDQYSIFSVGILYEALSAGTFFLTKWKDDKGKQDNLSMLKKEMKKWIQQCKSTVAIEEPTSPYNGLIPWLDSINADI